MIYIKIFIINNFKFKWNFFPRYFVTIQQMADQLVTTVQVFNTDSVWGSP